MSAAYPEIVTDALEPIPRRGTPNFRRWLFRALAVGALPPLAAGLGIAAIRLFDSAAASGGQLGSDIGGFLSVCLVLTAVLGALCLIDPRTRVSGIATIVIAALINPVSVGVVKLIAGIPW